MTHQTITTEPLRARRTERLEVRTTPHDRELINRAAAAAGVDLTEFVVSNLTVAARRVLADRSEFVLDANASERWDELNRSPARTLEGLTNLLARSSPFTDE